MKPKKLTAVFMTFCLTVTCLSGCGGTEKKNISLTVWTSKASRDVMQKIVDKFVEENKDKANLEISVGTEEENSLYENIKDYPADAADVFCMVDDQLDNLVKDKILLPIDKNKDQIIERNGGRDSISIQCAMRDDTLYAYPMTTGNGYFLYYNSEYLSENDVKSLDGILKAAEKNNKYFAMDWTSGWYIYSFFKGAGFSLTVKDDKTGNNCDWNTSVNNIKGTDVAQAMLNISSSPAFMNAPEDTLKSGFKDGSIIAGVSGLWNSAYLEECLGENYSAVKLPTYTVCDKQIQMGSFEGCKLVGVNSHTDEKEWAMKLAEWITSKDSELMRYDAIGEIPADISATSDKRLADSPAVSAIVQQSKYSSIQRIGSSYWSPATTFGTIMAAGNRDGADLQTLLDTLVKDSGGKKD